MKRKRSRRRPVALDAERSLIPDEHQEQVVLMRMIQLNLPELFEHVFAVPNGGFRNIKTARYLKAEGVKPGVPDVLCLRARGPFFGMALELKRLNASPSNWGEEQRRWSALLNQHGYLSVVAKGADKAFEQFAAYWALGEPSPGRGYDSDVFQTEWVS